jgi:hypothetical protein
MVEFWLVVKTWNRSVDVILGGVGLRGGRLFR